MTELEEVFEKYCGTIEDDKKAAMNWKMLTLDQFQKALKEFVENGVTDEEIIQMSNKVYNYTELKAAFKYGAKITRQHLIKKIEK